MPRGRFSCYAISDCTMSVTCPPCWHIIFGIWQKYPLPDQGKLFLQLADVPRHIMAVPSQSGTSSLEYCRAYIIIKKKKSLVNSEWNFSVWFYRNMTLPHGCTYGCKHMHTCCCSNSYHMWQICRRPFHSFSLTFRALRKHTCTHTDTQTHSQAQSFPAPRIREAD